MRKFLKLLSIALTVVAVAMAMAFTVTGCDDEHVHKWSEWQSDETGHWRECKKCKETERAEHTYGSWRFVDGAHVRTCAICQYKNTTANHIWGDWTRTATTHSRRCICGEVDSGTHSSDHKCEDCGAYFHVMAFGYTSGGDAAHADFAREANDWFTEQGKTKFFTFETHTGFETLTEANLANCDLLIFYNSIMGDNAQRTAFKNYMDNGGAFMCYHAAGGYYDGKPYPSEWQEWFYEDLMRTGLYGNCPRDPSDRGYSMYWNTWNPTAEPLRVEEFNHFATKNLILDENDEFMSPYCEWYEWEHNLFEDEGTTVLLSMNPTPENPAGDDPRPGDNYQHQIWEGGHHPIAWQNNNYNMIYMNWGHNCQSYNDFVKTSRTFANNPQICQFTIDAMYGLVEAGL